MLLAAGRRTAAVFGVRAMRGGNKIPEEYRATKRCVKCGAKWKALERCGYCRGDLVLIARLSKRARMLREFPLFRGIS